MKLLTAVIVVIALAVPVMATRYKQKIGRTRKEGRSNADDFQCEEDLQ